jgi:hypothetical protein
MNGTDEPFGSEKRPKGTSTDGMRGLEPGICPTHPKPFTTKSGLSFKRIQRFTIEWREPPTAVVHNADVAPRERSLAKSRISRTNPISTTRRRDSNDTFQCSCSYPAGSRKFGFVWVRFSPKLASGRREPNSTIGLLRTVTRGFNRVRIRVHLWLNRLFQQPFTNHQNNSAPLNPMNPQSQPARQPTQ